MGSLRTSFQVSRSIRVWCLWPTLTESPGARDLTDSPRDAPSTTSRALASPSGDLSSTSPPDHPTRLLLTAPTALLDGAIAQDNGLVPIVEPEILLDGTHD